MITNIIPFPSIERLTCHKLKQHAKYAFYNPQTVNFRGTIKLNGAHAVIIVTRLLSNLVITYSTSIKMIQVELLHFFQQDNLRS